MKDIFYGKTKPIITIVLLVLALTTLSLTGFVNIAQAANDAKSPLEEICRTAPDSSVCVESGLTDDASAEDNKVLDFLARVVGLMLYGLGIAAVLAIIVAGIMFATSGGDPQKTQKARNVIIYALVGLMLAVAAQLIITFVLDRL